MYPQCRMKSGVLGRLRLRTTVIVLALGLFVFAAGAKLSCYLPQNDLVHYLSSSAKMNGERHDKVVTALAAEFTETIFLEDAPAALSLPSTDDKSPKSAPVLLPHQFRSPPLGLG